MPALDPGLTSYFRRVDDRTFCATEAVQGAWNPREQHIAPLLGLTTHVMEKDHADRGGSLKLRRASWDILGVLAVGEVEVDVRVIRPGRTIELVETTLSHDGRVAAIGRAWFQQVVDTTAFAGTDVPPLPAPEEMPAREASTEWPGNFVRSVEVRQERGDPGRGRFWVRPLVDLIADEAVSTTATMFGVIDIANGLAPRASGEDVAFPNLDLTVHVVREPVSAWAGFDTTVTFGPDGTGLTQTVLHDEAGMLGGIQQILTLRPRG